MVTTRYESLGLSPTRRPAPMKNDAINQLTGVIEQMQKAMQEQNTRNWQLQEVAQLCTLKRSTLTWIRGKIGRQLPKGS